MGEEDLMIGNVLPVQLNLPQQKDKQLELQSKEEHISFSEKMNEKPIKESKLQNTEKSEAPKEIQQNVHEGNKIHKNESFVPKKELEGKKETEELLAAVSEQMLALVQLSAQPELLYQYIQKIQELYKTYGNIKLNELPSAELQQLVACFKDSNIKNAICLEDTMQTVLEKLTAAENMMEFTKGIQSENCDLTKKGEQQEPIAMVQKDEQGKPLAMIPKDEQGKPLVTIQKDEQDKPIELTTGAQDGKSILLGNDQAVKQDILAQKVSLPDLGKKMEAQVEDLQKFVVKQERVLFQLNPEKLGTLTVYMKKQGDQIQVHVEMDKHDAKKKVEIIFDELKNKLKDKEIHIELSYTDKEQKREQHEREQPHKRKHVVVKEEKKAEQDFAGLLEE
ncbi:flagellar hook-length control protein FliK [Bacillus pseudomycoides]|nr:flagellar hook-length control protein FliK [Bacillus pseudomycoides]